MEAQIINSKVIQQDIKLSLEEILSDLDISNSKESEIEALKTKLDSFQKDNQEVYEKIELLNKYGFTQTPSSTETLKELQKREEEIKAEINLIQESIDSVKLINQLQNEYQIKYPFLRFVPEQLMVSVMKKYNLFMADTIFYTKEVPNDALKMIDKYSEEITTVNQSSVEHILSSAERYLGDRNIDDYQAINPKALRMSNLKIIAPFSHFKIPTITSSRLPDKSIPLMISNDNNILEVNMKGIEALATEVREVLDPIAALKVPGGYIVLHAWDEEAEIPEIKNNYLN